MGFYLKKGINLGPLKINFSKSGIGFSVGTKGFRVGSGPKGNYVHAGAKGVYYRKNLPAKAMFWIILLIVTLVSVVIWAIDSGFIIINL